MLSAIECVQQKCNKTTIKNLLNVTSYIEKKQENIENNDMQLSNSWSNNQPLIVLGGCLSFVSSVFCLAGF